MNKEQQAKSQIFCEECQYGREAEISDSVFGYFGQGGYHISITCLKGLVTCDTKVKFNCPQVEFNCPQYKKRRNNEEL